MNCQPSRFIAWDTVVAWYKLPLVAALVEVVQQVLVVPYPLGQVARYLPLVWASACYSCTGLAAGHNTDHSIGQVEGTALASVDNLVDTNNSFVDHIHRHIGLLQL